MNKLRWTDANERHAFAQGWSLFTVDSGDLVIQKMDDPPAHRFWQEGMYEEPLFASDDAAIRFVRKQARLGDKIAQKAIAVHDLHVVSWRRWKRRNGR